jgi:thioredoxin 1
MKNNGIQKDLYLALVILAVSLSQAMASSGVAREFLPLERWKAAILGGDASALKAFYSANPPADISIPGGKSDAAAEAAFWTSLKARSVKLNVVQSDSPKPGLQQVRIEAEVRSAGSPGKPLYVAEGQLWREQDGSWQLVATKRSNIGRLQQPATLEKVIYNEDIDAHAEIARALQDAAPQHKRVIVVFGANWCYDCHVLDAAFQRPDFAPILEKNYEVVHVDTGKGDKNQDLMEKYGVPMKKGIPALAVLDSDGKLLVSQRNGEFENARALGPEDLLAFLNKWKR